MLKKYIIFCLYLLLTGCASRLCCDIQDYYYTDWWMPAETESIDYEKDNRTNLEKTNLALEISTSLFNSPNVTPSQRSFLTAQLLHGLIDWKDSLTLIGDSFKISELSNFYCPFEVASMYITHPYLEYVQSMINTQSGKKNINKENILHVERPYLFISTRCYAQDSTDARIQAIKPARLTLSPELSGFDQSTFILWREFVHTIIGPSYEDQMNCRTQRKGVQVIDKNCYIEYLMEDLKSGGTFITAYFELILWSTFQPEKDSWKILNYKGRIGKISFFSKSYNSTIELKFRIADPYCFKVKM